MDMTIAPTLCETDLERLRKARRLNGNPVLVAVLSAAIDIDQAEFRRAQDSLLDAVNAHTAHGARIPDEAHALVDGVRKSIAGHRYQTCTLRSCLDLVDAIHLGCTAISAGERIGRILQATAQLIAVERLRAAA